MPAWTKEEGAPLSDAGILDALTAGEWAKIAEMAKIPASACLAVCLQAAHDATRATTWAATSHLFQVQAAMSAKDGKTAPTEST